MKTLFESKLRLAISTIAILIGVYTIFSQHVWTTEWIVKNGAFFWTAQIIERLSYAVGVIFLFLLACGNARKPEERRRGIR